MTESLNAAAERLEPCPFCGSQDIDVRDFRVRCGACGAFSSWQEDQSKVIAAWNRRSTPTAPAGEWVTVPREPTQEMKLAAINRPAAKGFEDDYANLYRAMISAAPASPGRLEEVIAALRDLLNHIDRETCTHEETHRGGIIWTICDSCGRKWADDEGGFVPHSDAPAVAKARAILSASPVLSGGGMEGSACTDSADAPCFAAAKDAHCQSEGVEP